jgi:hypothetical protein
MYGSIFKLKIKSGHQEELLKTLKMDERKLDGAIAWFVMDPDDNSEWIGVAVFDNKQSYIDNANSPEQNENFLKMMEHLESEPTWTDGNFVINQIV